MVVETNPFHDRVVSLLPCYESLSVHPGSLQDYDRIQDLANQHKTLRQMLGHGDCEPHRLSRRPVGLSQAGLA
jgi:hypothetical protein